VSLPGVAIFVDAPDAVLARTRWALDTMLAPLGRTAAVTRDPAQASGAALAYAPEPIAGVPTIPCSAAALDLFAADRALPGRAFVGHDGVGGSAVAAFPADPGAGFAVPFDLVASAFVLLTCWDEHACRERDRFGRLPYSASVFAANPALRIERPAVDTYVEILRSVLVPRLVELAAAPLPEAGWMWGDGGLGPGSSGARFAVALTHDVDNLWRWTPAGLRGAARAVARALRHGHAGAAVHEVRDVVDWLVIHLPRGTDPYWTFLSILEGEDARRLSSTFYVIARHTAAVDGGQPETYARRIPDVLELLARGRREVGLHGNDADRLGAQPVAQDRADLALRAGQEVGGMRYHYLRCLYHETLTFLEQAGFAHDSSLAFAEHEGFRCGTSFPFHPYSLDEERPLQLIELPLALMDTTLQGARYRALEAPQAEAASQDVLDRARSAGGGIAMLWHNVRFDRRAAAGYDDVYWRLVDRAKADGAFVGSAGELVRRWQAATAGAAA